MFIPVHHLPKKKKMMRSSVSGISQVVNMDINIKLNLLIAGSGAFIKTAKLC